MNNNSNTIADESLQDAAQKFAENGKWNFDLALTGTQEEIRNESFQFGANWQKQKDSVVSEKLVDALNEILWSFGKNGLPSDKSIYVATQLLQSIKENKIG